MHRVQKLIAASGFCSRRKAEEYIADGKVTVNGVTIGLGDQCTEADVIMVGKQKITIDKHLYLMLNKPSGILTTRGDLWERKDVMSFLEGVTRPVYPIGRLDRDARGLLLFTSDGDFAQKILHPSNMTTKTYQAQLDKPLTKEALALINEGVYVDRRRVRAKLKKIKPKLVEITVHEGRNKIVKKIFNEVGYYVSDLKRVAIGMVRLDVAEGKWRELTQKEKEHLSDVELKQRTRRMYSSTRTTTPTEGSRRQRAQTKEKSEPRVRKSYRQRSPEEREHPKKREYSRRK